MTVDKALSLYKQTFATMKDNIKSFFAFRKMLLAFGLIDEDTYTKISFEFNEYDMSEKIRPKYFVYVLNEADIPDFTEFSQHNLGFLSDIVNLLYRINHVIINTEDSTIKYNKIEDDCGLPKWEKVMDESSIIVIDTEELIDVLYKYMIEYQYDHKINDNYLNVEVISRSKIVETSDMKSNIINWYKLIFEVEEIMDEDEFSKFVGYVEDADIIDEFTKAKILA